MDNVERADMKAGDILMCKYEGGIKQTVIEIGESVATGCSFHDYVHAAIVADAPPRETMLIESHGDGITPGKPCAPATVFRLNPRGIPNADRLSKSAADVARELMGARKANAAFGEYNRAMAAFSLLRTRESSDNTRAKVSELAARHYSGDMFCSMFVVICYQVAIIRMKDALKVLPLDVDAQAMQPSFLVQYLKSYPDQWIEVGDFDPVWEDEYWDAN